MKKKKDNLWFIPFNTPSLKNSKIKTSRGIFPSKTVIKYLRKLGIVKYSSSKKIIKTYQNKPNLFEESLKNFKTELEGKNLPYEIGFHFVRDTKRKFDFHNAVQIIADLLVAHDIIEDDNMDYFIPFAYKMNNSFYTVDKKTPGVYITLK